MTFFDQERLNQEEARAVQMHWVINQIWLAIEETSTPGTRRALEAHRGRKMPSLARYIQERRDKREKALIETLYDEDGMPTGWETKRAQ